VRKGRRKQATSAKEARHLQTVHPYSIQQLEKLLGPAKIQGDLALEVACGDGSLSNDLICRYYTKIDLFDRDPVEIKKVTKKFAKEKWARHITCNSMENYCFDPQAYDLIVFRWCIAFLDDP